MHLVDSMMNFFQSSLQDIVFSQKSKVHPEFGVFLIELFTYNNCLVSMCYLENDRDSVQMSITFNMDIESKITLVDVDRVFLENTPLDLLPKDYTEHEHVQDLVRQFFGEDVDNYLASLGFAVCFF